MKIYADQSVNVLIIEGVSQGSVTDFEFRFSEGFVDAYRIAAQIYDIKNLAWAQIKDHQGQTFSSPDTLMTYLTALTVPTFPLRFTASYPLRLDEDVVSLDQGFIKNNITLIDGQNF